MPAPEPARLPADAWRAPAVTRMLTARDFRAIFTLARRHGVGPARIAAAAGLDETLIRQVMTGDAVLTDPVHVEAVAAALDLPAPARATLGIGPRPGDPLHLPSEFWAQPDIARALAAWDVPAVLAAILDERRWTQQQLAGTLGYSQAWVSNVLRRDQSLSLDQARDIALTFGAPLHQLTLAPAGPHPSNDHHHGSARYQTRAAGPDREPCPGDDHRHPGTGNDHHHGSARYQARAAGPDREPCPGDNHRHPGTGHDRADADGAAGKPALAWSPSVPCDAAGAAGERTQALAPGAHPEAPAAAFPAVIAAPVLGGITPLILVPNSDLPGSSQAALASISTLIRLAQQPAPSWREREAFYEGLVQVLAAWADTMKRRELLQTLGWAATAAAANPVFPGLSLDEQERVVDALGGRHRIDDEVIGHIEAVLFSAESQDDALGPQAALDTVIAQRNLVRALLPGCPAAMRPRLLSLYANLSRLTGWLCFDLNDFDSAAYFYEQARTAAHEAEDTKLSVFTLCQLSHLATWRGQPRVGVDHAAAAAVWTKQTGDRLLSAYVANVSARAHARAGNQQACLATLDGIPAMLDGVGEQTPATSLAYFYGPGIYASSRARCLLMLHDPPAALAAAQQAVALIGPAFVRDKAFGMLHVANAYAQSQEIDEAARVIGAAAGLAAQNRSARLADSLTQSRRHLDPWRETAAVRDLDEQLAAHGWGAS